MWSPDLGAGGHGLWRLPSERLRQVPDYTFELHDEEGCLRVVGVEVHLAADLVLVFTLA